MRRICPIFYENCPELCPIWTFYGQAYVNTEFQKQWPGTHIIYVFCIISNLTLVTCPLILMCGNEKNISYFSFRLWAGFKRDNLICHRNIDSSKSPETERNVLYSNLVQCFKMALNAIYQKNPFVSIYERLTKCSNSIDTSATELAESWVFWCW